MTREIDRSPARLSAGLAASAGLVSAVSSALAAPASVAVGAPGFLLLVVGGVRGSRRAVTLGSAAMLAAALVGGVVAPFPHLLLPGVICAVLAWDFGEQAINVGEQLGRNAETTHLEATHAAGSTVVAVGAGGLGYGIFLGASGGQPVTALVFLLVAAVALTSALRT